MCDRLIELLRTVDNMRLMRKGFSECADYLLTNGVIVPPCKVGDTVYRISTKISTKGKYIQETKISRVAIDSDGMWLFCVCNPIAKCVWGKNVFLTKEEAEAALKGGVK